MNPPPIHAPPDPPQESSGLAVASLVLGICGIVLCLGPLAGIPAVVCGHIAQARIKRSGGAMKGGGVLLAGLITGYISIAMIVVLGLLAAIAIPNFVKARNKAQTMGCRVNLRAIQDAKELWARQNSKPDDAAPSDADIFGPGKFIDPKPQCPAGGSYT